MWNANWPRKPENSVGRQAGSLLLIFLTWYLYPTISFFIFSFRSPLFRAAPSSHSFTPFLKISTLVEILNPHLQNKGGGVQTVMAIVENILEVSSKLSSIQQFCEFTEDIHKITKCSDDCCSIRIYNDLLRTTSFDPELDFDYFDYFCQKIWWISLSFSIYVSVTE